MLLLSWVTIACALFMLVSEPPEPDESDEDQEAIRQRMLEWAERDADKWHETKGDRTIAWERAQGHLAIVVDDVGRELDLFDDLHELRYPLTFSVLPGSVYAAGIQQRLAADSRRPREVVLHLPMEPLDAKHMRAGANVDEVFLRVGDSPEQLVQKLEAALGKVPSAVGVNNHMGSRLTANTAAMRVVMSALHERGIYFMDSRTIADTVAETEASRAGVPTIPRHVFLDHEPDKAAIRESLAQAAERSREEPTVVIAHPSVEVVEVLREQLPRLHDAGVGIYPLSRLIADRHRA